MSLHPVPNANPEKATWDEISHYANHRERGDLIYEYRHHLAAEEYWRGVADAWTDCDRQGLTRSNWRELWLGGDQTIRAQCVMTEQERQRLARLPDRVRVHRGWWIEQRADRYYGSEPAGMSWTLDEELAHWFAMRFCPRWGQVISGWVRRDRILAFLMDRDESEVVVLPKFVTGREKVPGDPERYERYEQQKNEARRRETEELLRERKATEAA